MSDPSDPSDPSDGDGGDARAGAPGTSSAKAPPELIEALRVALRELAAADARESRLILRAGDAWLLVARTGLDDARWRVEAPASHRLPSRLRLDQPRGQWLREVGFTKPDGGKGDFVKSMEGEAADWVFDGLPALLVQVLQRAYLAPVVRRGALTSDVVHDDREHPQNPELLDAMRLVARRKDEESRMVLYNALANGTMLLAIDPAAPTVDDGPLPWLVGEQQAAGPVYDLYTDWDNFRRAHPLEHRYEAVHGADLFERAHELGALALNINPLGAVGGQLYALEIANMVTALRRWRAKHQH